MVLASAPNATRRPAAQLGAQLGAVLLSAMPPSAALLSAGLGVSAPARAQPAPSSARATPLEGVTVTARRIKPVTGVDVVGGWCPTRPRGAPAGPPRVLATYPREGEVVTPGPLTLRLSFDQPMNCGWAMTYDSPAELCTQIGMWDVPGRRTWSMHCTVPPGETVTVRFGAVSGHGFTALSGGSAPPLTLSFATAPAPLPGAELGAAPEIATPLSPPPVPAPERAGNLVCPEHRLRGSGPRCRYVADPAGAPAPAES